LSILLKNCRWIVTQNLNREVLENQSIYIEGDKIVDIGRISIKADEEVDCSKMVVMPGLINTHTHLSMTLFRGYGDDSPLKEWLENKIWPLERKLTGEICYWGALLGCLEMIKTGTTCFLDMYFFVKDVAKAVHKAGLKAFLSHAIIDFQGESNYNENALNEDAKFIKELRDNKIKLAISPHSPYTCTEETLIKCKEKAEKENLILHTHLAETRWEQTLFQKKIGLNEIEYLNKIGFLCSNLIAAHSVWLSKKEIRILKERNVKIAHCPVSNLKLASGGVAPIPEMLEENVSVSLGTDGAASNNCLDMFDTMKICALIHKFYRWDPAIMPAQKVLDLATLGGAEALNLSKEAGSVEKGKKADLILIDLRKPNLTPIHNTNTLISDLIYSVKGENVDSTIVNGEFLMKNGKFTKLNPEEIYEKAGEATEKLIS
jgi:5-methylthioadenosine/S-adenosylhomocysteine deaminase